MNSIYDFIVKDSKGNDVKLSKFRGNVLLIINSALKCGYTKQYDGLQKLYDKYQPKGLEILDFPCNQFFSQSPGSSQDIVNECQLNFGIRFTIFHKINVNGKSEEPLYTFLKKQAPKDFSLQKDNIFKRIFKKDNNKIKWNFTKFLVDRSGNVVRRFAPSFPPEKIEQYIVDIL